MAFDYLKVIVIRDGSAMLLSDFGDDPVAAGNVVVLGANALCGAEPDGHVTTTTIYVDVEYMVDQVFWQHADVLRDRLDAKRFVDALDSGPARILRLRGERVDQLTPWLDEMTRLSASGGFREHFHRMQALWFAISDVVTPFDGITAEQRPASPVRQRAEAPPARKLAPVRNEAVHVREALRSDITRNWTLEDMAALVHLSPKQLSRVFTQTFGKTPQGYLTHLRVEELARMLRETDATITEAGRRVGWRSRSRAAEAFRECTGVTPQRYRSLQLPEG